MQEQLKKNESQRKEQKELINEQKKKIKKLKKKVITLKGVATKDGPDELVDESVKKGIPKVINKSYKQFIKNNDETIKKSHRKPVKEVTETTKKSKVRRNSISKQRPQSTRKKI